MLSQAKEGEEEEESEKAKILNISTCP